MSCRRRLQPSVITSVVHDHAAPVAQYLSAIDMAAFLDGIEDSWHEKPVKELREEAEEQLGRNFSSNGFGRKVNAHPRWETHAGKEVQRVRLKIEPLL